MFWFQSTSGWQGKTISVASGRSSGARNWRQVSSSSTIAGSRRFFTKPGAGTPAVLMAAAGVMAFSACRIWRRPLP